MSVDINYFFQYGQEVWYKANHKRAEQSYKGVTSSAAELAFIKGDDIQGWCCFEMPETLELTKNDTLVIVMVPRAIALVVPK